MDAQNIMIGDWLRLRYNKYLTGEEVIKDFRVYQIRDDYGELCVWSEDGWNMGELERKREISHIEPIPLTPEILEKNGWHVGELELWYRHPEVNFLISLRTRGAYLYADEEHDKREFFCVIQSVHELQHALRLCKIEKEITI